MTVAAYLRVSDRARQADRWSLPAQREAIARRCAAEGWGEPTWYVEAHSAKGDDPDARPVFRQLLADAHARRFDTLVIVDVDRFARSVVAGLDAAARLERAGVRVVSLNDGDIDTADPDGEFTFTLKLMLARRENRVRARKVRAGMDAARAAGRHVHSPPYGARIDEAGHLALDPATSPTLARILREAALDSDAQVAGRLSADGIPPPGSRRAPGRWGSPGRRWWPDTIHGIVKNGAWLARLPDPWPALWHAAATRARKPRTRGDGTTRLLTGLARCACGAPLFHSGNQRGPRRLYFTCRSKERGGTGYGCERRRKKVYHYEDQVRAALRALPDPAEDRAIREEADPAAWAELADDRRRLDDRYRLRLIDYAQLVAELADLERREAALPRGAAGVVRLRAEVAPVLRRFDELDSADQNALARLLIAAVVIDGDAARICWRPEARALFGLPS